MLEINEGDPKEKTTPIKMEMPRKAPELDPGMYGKANTMAKAIMMSLAIRLVGMAQVLSKLANLICS